MRSHFVLLQSVFALARPPLAYPPGSLSLPLNRLGHSKVGFTLDVYSHLLPGMQEEAAQKVDSGLRAALEKQRRLS